MNRIVAIITAAAVGGTFVATSATHAAAFAPVPAASNAVPAAAIPDGPLPTARQREELQLRLEGVIGAFPAGLSERAVQRGAERALDLESTAEQEPVLRASRICVFGMCDTVLRYGDTQRPQVRYLGEDVLDLPER